MSESQPISKTELQNVFDNVRPLTMNAPYGYDINHHQKLPYTKMGDLMLGDTVSTVEKVQDVGDRSETVRLATKAILFEVGNWDFHYNGDIARYNTSKNNNYDINMQDIESATSKIFRFIDVNPSIQELISFDTWHDIRALSSEKIGNKLISCANAFIKAHRLPGESIPYIQRVERTLTVTGAPPQADIEPVPINKESLALLLSISPKEKYRALAHVLNPHRFTSSKTTDEEISDERTHIMSLIESLDDSWQKDLLSVSAFIFFKHRKVNNPELATQSLLQLNNSKAQSYVEDAYLVAEQIMHYSLARVRTSSKTELARLGINEIDEQSPEFIEAMDKARVTVHVSMSAVNGLLLEQKRLLSQFDAKTSINDRNTLEIQREDQHRLGILPKDDETQERPIYGALTLGEADETLERYGDCVVTLRPEVAMNRTIFSLGDSGSNRTTKPIDYRSAVRAKMELGSTSDKITFGYIEALIMGGVDVDDIEAITIPSQYKEKYPGVTSDLEDLFPHIKFIYSEQ